MGRQRASSAGGAVEEAATASGEDPVATARAARLARIVVRLEHAPDGDPDGFLDAVEASLGSVGSSATVAETEAFARAGISLAGGSDDPHGTRALLAGQQRARRVEAQALSVREAAARLKVSTSRVRQLIGDRHLLAVRMHDERVLPGWQFTEAGYVPGISVLADNAAHLHPVELAQFMTRPNVDLTIDGEPVTPVEWLTGGGDPAPVANLVESLTY